MNELQAVSEAYAAARGRGERVALATVIHVEGSAYRRAGARMIITERGRTVGTISGGCLERDVVEHASQVIATGAARVVTYDTRGDDDIVWGLGLGCNGVVEILLESLHEGSEGARAIEFIAECLRARGGGVIATLVGATESPLVVGAHRVGARMLLDDALNVRAQGFADQSLCARVREDARALLDAKRSAKRVYQRGAGASQTEAGTVKIFFDVIAPPRALVVFGAERDAVPVVQLAKTVGWHVTVVDTRARVASRERFAVADEVVLCRAQEMSRHVSLTAETAAVLMTHNYLDDAALLPALIAAPLRYLGILGPKRRTAKLLADVRREGCEVAQATRVHSPIGIDIGAETPEEIALAIVAEIKAVCAARRGGFLRESDAPIHDDARNAPHDERDVPISDESDALLSQVESSSSSRAITHENVPLASCRVA